MPSLPKRTFVQYPLVFFGNGYWARAEKQFPIYKDENGISRRKFLLSLSEAIKEEYQIEENYANVDYPSKKVYTLSNEYSHPCILIFCGFKGEKTEFEEYYAELLKIIEVYEKNEQTYLSTIFHLQEQMKEISTVNEYQLKRIANMYKIISSAKKIEDKEKETETEEEDISGG